MNVQTQPIVSPIARRYPDATGCDAHTNNCDSKIVKNQLGQRADSSTQRVITRDADHSHKSSWHRSAGTCPRELCWKVCEVSRCVTLCWKPRVINRALQCSDTRWKDLERDTSSDGAGEPCGQLIGRTMARRVHTFEATSLAALLSTEPLVAAACKRADEMKCHTHTHAA